MKKIAFISDGWKRLITYAWTDGIMKRIKSGNEDICLYQFHCYGNWSKNAKHNKGEYNIYRLVNFKDYDGVIVDCNNIEDKDQLDWLIKHLKTLSIPVVSLSYAIEGLYYVGIDNREPITQIMNHMYYEHGCRTFMYAGGPKDNYENSRRLDAFKNSLKTFNIPITEDMILYGDYDFYTGVRYIREIVERGRPLPDVIVCANDNIAAGICNEAEKLGLRVPDDFKVTGFDNLDKAAYFRPQITTVAHNRGEIGTKAVEMLIDIWKGKNVAPFQFVQSKLISGESCGCSNNGLVDYREYMKEQIIWNVSKQEADENLELLESAMSECQEFEQVFDLLKLFFKDIDCDGFYFIIDKKLRNADLNTIFIEEGYDFKNMEIVAAVEDGQEVVPPDTLDFFRHLDEKGQQSSYLLTPIHFEDKAIGIFVLKNSRFLYDNPYFYDIENALTNTLENLYKQKQIAYTMAQLKDLYNKDQLTGLYNRVAYKEMILPEFRKCHRKKVSCAMVFYDMDNFKIINDTRGHKYGDQLLIKTADIIRANEPEGAYSYRFGGDEFVVFFPNATDEKVKEYKERMEAALKKHNVLASIGVIVTDPESSYSFDDYLVMADTRMYEEKEKRKALRLT